MRKLRNFKCTDNECNAIQERLVNDDIETLECKACGGNSNKMLSCGRYLDNTTGRSPAIANR